MASLTGNTIASTYDGLLKFTDNEAAQSSLKNVTDGVGNATALNLASNQASVSGSLLVTGSILVSGSIIPSVPGGADLTSSFSLGSPEAAWKDLYVSDGTIYFLSREGRVNGTVSAGSDGMAFDGDIKVSNSGSTRISERQAIDIGRGPGASARTLTNTRVGQAALAANVSGSNNTAIGYQALSGSTSGTSNTAVGYQAGVGSHDTGSSNTMIGAGARGILGNHNTAVGNSALSSHEGGGRNTAIGSEALSGLFTGGYNTALGYQAGAGAKVDSIGSIYIGYDANPFDRNNAPDYELYINSRPIGTPVPAGLIPLIGGNFVSRSINLNGRTILSGSVSISGSVSVSGSIVPAVRAGSTTSSFSLGSPTAAWKDIYVADGTIYMLSGSGTVNGTIAANAITLNSGSLTINGGLQGQGTNYVLAPSLRSWNIYPMGFNNAWNSGIVSGNVQVPSFPYLEGSLQGGQEQNGVYTIYGYLKIGNEYYDDTSSFEYLRAVSVWRDNVDSGTPGSPTFYPKPVFRTVITDNSTVLEGNNANTTINALVTANGRKHVLTVTGSMLVRGGVSLGVSASNQHIITGTTTISGSVIMSGSIIPVVSPGSTTSSFSLGSPTAAWKDIYVSDGTIYMLGGSGSVNGTIAASGITLNSGSLTVSGSQTVTGTTTLSGSTTVTGSSTTIGTSTVSGSQVISGSTALTGSQTITGSQVITGTSTISGSLVITGSAITPLPVTQGINSVSEYTIRTAGVYTITGSFAGNLGFGNPALVPGHVVHVINTTNAIINVSPTYAPLSGGEGGAIAGIPEYTYYQFVAVGNNWRGGKLFVA